MPTSETAHVVAKGKAKAGMRPIAFVQDYYGSTGAGEMLIWNWDDGNPDNVEGTVWLRSYSTGNETTFNIQLAGDTYETMYAPWEETVDAGYNEPPPPYSGAPAPAPQGIGNPAPVPNLGTSFGIRMIGLGGQRERCDNQTRSCTRQEEQRQYNQCTYQWIDAQHEVTPMNYPFSRRETILLIIFVVVIAQIVKHLPRDLWWAAGVIVFAGSEVLALILRRPPTPGRVAGGAVAAVLISLAVRFL